MLSRSNLSVESRIEISSLLARLSELFHYIAEQTGAERRLLVPVRTFQQMSTSLSLLEPESKAVAALHNFDLLMRDLLTDLRLAASVAYGVHTGQPSDIVALPQAGSLLSRAGTFYVNNGPSTRSFFVTPCARLSSADWLFWYPFSLASITAIGRR